LGKEHNFEEKGVNIDNQPAVYLSKKIPLHNFSGKVIGTLGLSFDITERKQMEEELKIAKEKAEISNRVKSQFVAAVNHELRTPLASIIGLVDLLKEEGVHTEESKKIIDSIESSAQHLLNLVNDVLDFSKLETGKQDLQITTINLPAVLSEAYDLLNPLAKNKNLTFLLDIENNLPTSLLTDARILRHIIINLASNAIKFTEKGQVTIHVQHLKQFDKQIQLKISITDTGFGIPADKLNVIFKPFQQLKEANVRQSSRNGTGLGLTIVKKLAEAIDATLEVESQLGKGSTFSLTATFAIPDEKNLDEQPLSLPLRKSIHKPRVLIVEDDPIIQYIHKKLLTNLASEVDVASTATEAMKILNHHHDIIFSDNSLPDISGQELIKTIRQTTSFNCPIVIISAFLDKAEETACLHVGANDFVSKPISLAKFKELLSQHCYIGEPV
jgi:signal transduction histidine kinase